LDLSTFLIVLSGKNKKNGFYFSDKRLQVKIFFVEWEPSRLSKFQLFRGILVALELLLLEPKTQINGIKVIFNFDGLSFSQIFEATPSFLRMAFDLVRKLYFS
jgi:hypothetical protein